MANSTLHIRHVFCLQIQKCIRSGIWAFVVYIFFFSCYTACIPFIVKHVEQTAWLYSIQTETELFRFCCRFKCIKKKKNLCGWIKLHFKLFFSDFLFVIFHLRTLAQHPAIVNKIVE